MLAVPASASAVTRTVDMGTPPSASKAMQKTGSDANAFFPSTTTIHTGDSVRFRVVGFHNLDLPKKGGGATPLLVPQAGKTVTGLADAAGAAFWFNGQPVIGFNFPALAPAGFGKKFTYTGAKGIQSGLPLANKPKPVTVKFAKTGSYTYYCDIHPGMKGKVNVRAKSKRIPSAKAHAARIKAQASAALATAKKLAKTQVPAGTVDLGVAGKGGVEYFGMVPAQTTVPVGTTLTFQMSPGSYEVHTATFGPGNIEDPNSFIGKIAKSFEGAEFDQSGVYPSEAPGTVATYTSALHGNGFWNSGALDRVGSTPIPASSQVMFGAAGTYTFYCLIHPFMKGTVTVQ
jgi:plastocyanin